VPPGRPFRLPLTGEAIPVPVPLTVPRAPFFPPDPALASWTVEAAAELERTGPPVLLAAAGPGEERTRMAKAVTARPRQRMGREASRGRARGEGGPATAT